MNYNYGFFSSDESIKSFFSGSKADEAAELYVKAANLYKIAKKWNGTSNFI